MKKTKKPAFDRPMTIIGEATELTATVLKSSEPIKIVGRFIGDIVSDSSIVIADSGYVKGKITAEYAYVCGVAEGDLDITETLQVSHNGNIQGNIVCGNLITDEGAVLNGGCTMRPLQSSSSEYLD